MWHVAMEVPWRTIGAVFMLGASCCMQLERWHESAGRHGAGEVA